MRYRRPEPTNPNAFTLIEVVVSTTIAAIVVGGMIYAYVTSAARTEWSGYSLAAQALATQRLEQTRACKWDQDRNLDELVATNFPVQVAVLDLPVAGTNLVYATNVTTITWISTNAPKMKMIRVDCSWTGPRGRVHTNTAASYRAPDT
ncbi:MAG: type IV pilus modification PilV family protein [Limisphaerales bacterium]